MSDKDAIIEKYFKQLESDKLSPDDKDRIMEKFINEWFLHLKKRIKEKQAK
jgi:hypothetical protein